jgi:hypothetical protein
MRKFTALFGLSVILIINVPLMQKQISADCNVEKCHEVSYWGSVGSLDTCFDNETDGADALLGANTDGMHIRTTFAQEGGHLENHPSIFVRNRRWTVCNFQCPHRPPLGCFEVIVSGTTIVQSEWVRAAYCKPDK